MLDVRLRRVANVHSPYQPVQHEHVVTFRFQATRNLLIYTYACFGEMGKERILVILEDQPV